MEAYATCCSLKTMQQGFGLGMCIYQKRYFISVARVRNRSCGVSSVFCICQSKAIFFIKSTFETRSLGKKEIGMGLMCLLAAHLWQCQRSLCLHPVNEFLHSCFYITSLWLRRFLWGDRRPELFAPFSLCGWSQMPVKNLQIIVYPQSFNIRCIVKIYDVDDQFLRKPVS